MRVCGSVVVNIQTIAEPLKTRCFQGFSLCLEQSFPLLAPGDGANKGFHTFRDCLFHLLGHVPVAVKRERRRRVSEVLLHRLNVVATHDRGDCAAVIKHMGSDMIKKTKGDPS